MAGDCFWTALVNCFDDCGAAPPPPPPGDNIVFGEDFSTLPNARAPSAGPVGFTSSSNTQVGVSGGFMASTVASADDGVASITFSGSGMEPAIGMSVGFTLNDAAMTVGKEVWFRIEATESTGVNPVGLSFSIKFRYGLPGFYGGLKFNGIGDDYSYAPPEDGGFMQWGGTNAQFAEEPGDFSMDAAYEMRLMWSGSGLVFSINGVDIDTEPFSGGSALHHMPQFNDINVQVFSWNGVQQALALDYVRLIGEP